MNHTASSGDVAVITGAASGIGAGLARYAADRGMAVVLADWDEGALSRFADTLSGEIAMLKVDVRKTDDMKALADLAYDRFGRVDLLFNNAGVLSSGISWELPVETWQRVFDVNVMGVVNGIAVFVPRMLAAQRPARVINTASVGGFFSGGLIGPYFASKAAIVSLTETLAHDLASVGAPVTVSLLAPGPVSTGILREKGGAGAERMMDRMRELTAEHSADPDAYARLIFEAIDRGDYWIVPQPEALDPRLEERTRMILARQSPAEMKDRSRDKE